MKANEEAKAQQQLIAKMDPGDPLRFNSCGTSWDNADARCGMWCWGEESDCPPGEGCFGDTSCYNDAGLVPSPVPTTYPPTSRTPTVRADPTNYRFCGKQWDSTPCTIEAHCPIGTECKNGDTCFTKQRCNVHDLTHPPTNNPSTSPTIPHDHASYHKYCGKSYSHATINCSLKTHCAEDGDCPSGAKCFEDLPEQCNSFYMEYPEFRPTVRPTGRPTTPRPTDPTRRPTARPSASPTTRAPTRRDDPRNMRFCGNTWNTVTCSLDTHCPLSTECTNGQTCFTIQRCNVHDLTAEPTPKPSSAPMVTMRPTGRPTTPRPTGPSRSPTPLPSASPTTRSPTRRDDPINMRFCGNTWDTVKCTLENFCPTGSECTNGQICFTEQRCNVQDITETPTPKPSSPPMVTSRPTRHPMTPPPTGPSQSPTPAPSVSPTTRAPTMRDDPRNMRFCGDTWNTVTCSIETHCPTGLECTNGQICFTEQRCNVQDLTETPTVNPSSSPTLPIDHPSHFRFCGNDFSDAVEHCSVETHCTSDDNCSAAAAEKCYENLPGHCNVVYLQYPDLRPTALPTPRPTPPLRTFRPTRKPISAPSGLDEPPLVIPVRTFRPTHEPSEGNDEPMPMRTFRPTHKPSAIKNKEPPAEDEEPPVVEVNPAQWCGKTQSEANSNCGYNFFWCVDSKCPSGWECFTVEDHLCAITLTSAVEMTTSRTKRPTFSPIQTTRRPTNIPTMKPSTSAPTTKKTTAKPVTNSPVKQTPSNPVMNSPVKQSITTKPVTNSPVKQPTRKPVTKNPTKQPTPKPVTSSPTNQPTPKPVTVNNQARPAPTTKIPPSPPPTSQHNILTSSPTTPSPTKNAPARTPAPETVFQTNKKPNGGKPKKPSLQSTTEDNATGKDNVAEKPSLQSIAKDDATGKDNVEENPSLQSTTKDNAPGKDNVEENPSMVEGLETTTTSNNRPRLYCLSQVSNFDEECIHGMECSEGNPCPSGHSCLQFDCKNRPPSNGSLDLCPFRFVGKHTKDCKSYHECDYYGYVGPTYTCEEGFKFDKSSGRCISEFLVNSQCYQPDSHIEIDSTSDEIHDILATTPSKTSSTIITPPPTSLSSSHSPTPSPNTDSPTSDFLLLEASDSPPLLKVEHDLSQWYNDGSGAGLMIVNWLSILLPIQFILFSCAMW